MRDERENPAPPILNIARSDCAAGISIIDSLNDRAQPMSSRLIEVG
jgi:hypothetical protein